MKRKKAALIIGLALCFALLPVYSAYADVIPEPDPYNAFYEAHWNVCETVYEHYKTTADVEVYWSPEDDYVLTAFGKGEGHLIRCTYDRDGELWGLVDTGTNDAPDENGELTSYYEGVSGWVRMSEMARLDGGTSSSIADGPVPYNGDMPAWQIILVAGLVALVAGLVVYWRFYSGRRRRK